MSNNFSYKVLKDNLGNVTILRSDFACIPCDEANNDYLAYLAWVAEGNKPAE